MHPVIILSVRGRLWRVVGNFSGTRRLSQFTWTRMQTPGEELVGEYLRHIRNCEFVQYNLQTSHVQGEIDVIGINMSTRTLYVCEVAVHLITGLQYVKNKRPDNIDRFITKFTKDIQYARSALPEYKHVFMLWSPIVKQRTNPQYDQMSHVQTIHARLQTGFDVDLQLIIIDHQ